MSRSLVISLVVVLSGMLALPFRSLADGPNVKTPPASKKADKNAADKNTSPKEKEAADAAKKKKDDDEYYELYKSFADSLDQIEHNYVKDISRRELMEAAIRGMLTKLDPYSSYIGPEDLSGFKTAVESQFGGIGIQVSTESGQIKVLSPLMDTPAYRAGIRAGDHIIKIEGNPTDGMAIDDAVKKLKGEVGTKVTFTIQHAGSKKEETVTVKREIIQLETVLGDRRSDDDHWDFMFDADKKIGYIRIASFSRDTARDVKRALEKLQTQKVHGLVLDLRNNPGGLLTSAVDICDLFVPDGVIVSTEGRNSPKRVWEAHKEKKFDTVPVAVLVNQYSASASEIVSACLQDHKRAVVIGERTWGKGSVQNVIELEDGKSALKLTTAGYLRPSGRNIHRYPGAKDTEEWGVQPNEGYEIKVSDGELGRMMQIRHDRDMVLSKRKGDAKNDKPDATPAVTPESPKTSEEKPKEFVDRPLQKAMEYLSSELAKVK